MSEKLDTRAEIVKLGRLLSRPPEDLDYLVGVPAADLRRLREQITDVLFESGDGALGRLAAASKLLPVGLVATLAERVFGPVLSARIAGLLEPDRSAELAARLPVSFLAEVAIDLDPRRARNVIARIPPERVAAVTGELVERGEYVTMGRFVGELDRPAVEAALQVMDDETLLRTAFVLEHKKSLRTVIDVLTASRLDSVLDTAVAANLLPEVLDVFAHLSNKQQRLLLERATARDDKVLNALIATAQADGMWHAILPLTRLMSDETLGRLATLKSIQADGVLENIVRVASTHDELWAGLIPIVSVLPDAAQGRVAVVVSELDLTESQLSKLGELRDRLGS
jgi:hypothetical protein